MNGAIFLTCRRSGVYLLHVIRIPRLGRPWMRRLARTGTLLWAAAALSGVAAMRARAQDRLDPAALAKVNAAAFDHWWPKYQRLMDRLIENQGADPGRLRVPPPAPGTLRAEIHVGAPFRNPNLPGYTFYGVHAQGAVFEGLFLMDPTETVTVLVNHDDPEDRKPVIEDAYVDHMNEILDRADVSVDNPSEAASLARFFLSLFFNFNLHPEEAPISSAVHDELMRVRVVSSYLEIPQGRRVMEYGSKDAHLVFAPVPGSVREKIQPPVVLEPERGAFVVKLFTWHPVRGEVKSWEVRIEGAEFVYFKDQVVARWKPYRFEGLN